MAQIRFEYFYAFHKHSYFLVLLYKSVQSVHIYKLLMHLIVALIIFKGKGVINYSTNTINYRQAP